MKKVLVLFIIITVSSSIAISQQATKINPLTWQGWNTNQFQVFPAQIGFNQSISKSGVIFKAPGVINAFGSIMTSLEVYVLKAGPDGRPIPTLVRVKLTQDQARSLMVDIHEIKNTDGSKEYFYNEPRIVTLNLYCHWMDYCPIYVSSEEQYGDKYRSYWTTDITVTL